MTFLLIFNGALLGSVLTLGYMVAIMWLRTRMIEDWVEDQLEPDDEQDITRSRTR